MEKNNMQTEKSTSEEAINDLSTITSFVEARHSVSESLGEHTAFVLEVAASNIMALTLNGLTFCQSLILEGPSGSSKTTVIELMKPFNNAYYTDNFTPASFVSHFANKTNTELEEIDLLPKITHKVLMIPDLAPSLGNRNDARAKSMGIMTRVLDGQGYSSESGVHGGRGYQGDYRFGLLAATTPFTQNLWELIARLGPRLLILDCQEATKLDVDDLITSLKNNYWEQLSIQGSLVSEVLDDMWNDLGGFGSVKWSVGDDDTRYVSYLAKVVMWVVKCKGTVELKQEEGKWKLQDAPKVEDPRRLLAALWSLARGHALLYGRKYLEARDLQVSVRVAMDTMPKNRRVLIREVLRHESGKINTGVAASALGTSKPTAKGVMRELGFLGAVEYVAGSGTTPAKIRLKPEQRWMLEDKHRWILELVPGLAEGAC